MISLITVNWNAADFLDLLIESTEIFSSRPLEIIVVDNSLQKRPVQRPHVIYHPTTSNIGHGAGLNLGVTLANPNFPYLMFLDVDAHFISHGWEEPFIGMLAEFDVVGGRGVPAKPIRPACMFMKKEFGKYDWRDTPGYKGHRVTPEGMDVAIKAYHEMLKDGVKVGFLDGHDNHYDTATGEEWAIQGRRLVYHHWHGSHLPNRQVDFQD
jgi:glycosyltransferase involved in cell wall biosynthesis